MDRESNMKYIVTLNDDISDEMLVEKGFVIEETKNFIWAIKRAKRTTKNSNEPRGTIIIRLDPPDRKVVFRYSYDDNELDLLQEIDFMKGMFKVKMR